MFVKLENVMFNGTLNSPECHTDRVSRLSKMFVKLENVMFNGYLKCRSGANNWKWKMESGKWKGRIATASKRSLKSPECHADRVSRLSKMFVKPENVLLNDYPKYRNGSTDDTDVKQERLCSMAIQSIGVGRKTNNYKDVFSVQVENIFFNNFLF